uniref:Uncharacterized protein n=1 Tax=Arundo donax TaxID=35708 RepID=A0A0A9A026_ARUDO
MTTMRRRRWSRRTVRCSRDSRARPDRFLRIGVTLGPRSRGMILFSASRRPSFNRNWCRLFLRIMAKGEMTIELLFRHRVMSL